MKNKDVIFQCANAFFSKEKYNDKWKFLIMVILNSGIILKDHRYTDITISNQSITVFH